MMFKLKQKREQDPEQGLVTWQQSQQDFQAGYMAILQDMDRAAEQTFLVKSAETKKREQNDKAMFQLIQADANIDYCKERIGELYALLDLAELELAQAMVGGTNQIKQQKQVMSYKKQIKAEEDKLRKAQFCRYSAEQKLSAM